MKEQIRNLYDSQIKAGKEPKDAFEAVCDFLVDRSDNTYKDDDAEALTELAIEVAKTTTIYYDLHGDGEQEDDTYYGEPVTLRLSTSEDVLDGYWLCWFLGTKCLGGIESNDENTFEFEGDNGPDFSYKLFEEYIPNTEYLELYDEDDDDWDDDEDEDEDEDW